MQATAYLNEPTADGSAAQLLLKDRQYNIVVKVVHITRELARQWLAHNTLNRSLRHSNLLRLSQALQAGTWAHCNGETIVFGDDGSLLDGQHRLQAVVDTGIPITSLVVWGVVARKRSTIDTGSMRALGDYFAMQGFRSGRNLAAALAVLALWERGATLTHHLMSLTIFSSYDEALAEMQRHAGLVDNLKDARRMPKIQPLSELAALGYLFEQKDRKVHAQWVHAMIHGTQYADTPSLTSLRERLLRDSTSRTRRPPFEAFGYQIKAFNAARKHRPLRVFKLYANEPFPTLD